MVLCLLSRDSHGDTTKLNHEETVRGPEIAISPEKGSGRARFASGGGRGQIRTPQDPPQGK